MFQRKAARSRGRTDEEAIKWRLVPCHERADVNVPVGYESNIFQQAAPSCKLHGRSRIICYQDQLHLHISQAPVGASYWHLPFPTNSKSLQNTLDWRHPCWGLCFGIHVAYRSVVDMLRRVLSKHGQCMYTSVSGFICLYKVDS